MLNSFLSGAIFMGCCVVALQFRRLWLTSGDRLFAYFCAAFLVFAAERIVLETVSPKNEFAPFVYLVRLLAFAFIIAGVIEKNRAR